MKPSTLHYLKITDAHSYFFNRSLRAINCATYLIPNARFQKTLKSFKPILINDDVFKRRYPENNIFIVDGLDLDLSSEDYCFYVFDFLDRLMQQNYSIVIIDRYQSKLLEEFVNKHACYYYQNSYAIQDRSFWARLLYWRQSYSLKRLFYYYKRRFSYMTAGSL